VSAKDARELAKARAALLALFPAMPAADVERVLDHAFRKGSGRVGRTGGHSIERRASLAVGAHIRHEYTEYDGLIAEVGREEARKRIRDQLERIKQRWTGRE